MKKEQISRIIDRIDAEYIDEAALFAKENGQTAPDDPNTLKRRTEKPAKRFRWTAAAACLAVLLIAGGGVMYKVQAKEYRTAIGFFEENKLSAEGLSRADIKAVYRDIITQSFTYDKTAEVLGQTVSGREIVQTGGSPEPFGRIWQQKAKLIAVDDDLFDPETDPRYASGILFVSREQYGKDAEGAPQLEKNVLRYYRDGKLRWTADFPNLCISNCSYFDGETLVWLRDYNLTSWKPTYAWVACLDESGTVKWQKRLEHGFNNEEISAILPNDDGSWAVISRGDFKYLCLTRMSRDGEEMSFRKNEVGNYGIWNAARFGDGYIVHLGSNLTEDYTRLYRMDREGDPQGELSFEGDDCVYHVVDMADFAGQLYLSAYAVPRQKDLGWGRAELTSVCEYIRSKENYEISDEELTGLLRENYTAVLLICDLESGTMQSFWSVKGSFGGKLKVNGADRLEWDVESISSSLYSIGSNYPFQGSCRVFRYSFNTAGGIVSWEDTNETVAFSR